MPYFYGHPTGFSFENCNADILAVSCKPQGVNMFRVLSTFAVI